MPFLESMDWALPTWACVSLRGVAQRVAEALLNPQSPPPGRWVALGPLVGGTLGEPVRRNGARGFGGEHGCWVPCLLWALAEGENRCPSLHLSRAFWSHFVHERDGGWLGGAAHYFLPVGEIMDLPVLLEFTHTASNLVWGKAA